MTHLWHRRVWFAGLATCALASCSGNTANCDLPGSAASIASIVVPDYPDTAKQQGATGVATVAVTVKASGAIVSTKLVRSSGNAAIDNAAIAGADASTYQGGFAGCGNSSNVDDVVDYVATFDGGVTVQQKSP